MRYHLFNFALAACCFAATVLEVEHEWPQLGIESIVCLLCSLFWVARLIQVTCQILRSENPK
jgi:hypothetical protein